MIRLLRHRQSLGEYQESINRWSPSSDKLFIEILKFVFLQDLKSSRLKVLD